MPHSFNKIWIHAIWATKERRPLIEQNIEKKVYQFISEQLREQGCPVRIINGMPDHIHCLFLLSPQKSIAEVVKQIKGSSSHFINHNKTKSNIMPRKHFRMNMRHLSNYMALIMGNDLENQRNKVH
jgi:putative transposase